MRQSGTEIVNNITPAKIAPNDRFDVKANLGFEGLTTEAKQCVEQGLGVFRDILGELPYVSFDFGEDRFAVHITEGTTDAGENQVCVTVVPHRDDDDRGARFSDISLRVFGEASGLDNRVLSESIRPDFSSQDAESFLNVALRCQRAHQAFAFSKVKMLHSNPQGFQGFTKQVLGVEDTGGQNQYVRDFAKALGKSLIDCDESQEAPAQIILNRGGESHEQYLNRISNGEIAAKTIDPSVRRGVHYFPDENVALAFVEDDNELFTRKETTHPKFELISTEEASQLPREYVVDANDNKLAEFGIEPGFYRMVDPGPMMKLAQYMEPLLSTFRMGKEHQETDGSRVIAPCHYVDGCYLVEFINQTYGTNFIPYFFEHSLGAYKGDGLNYPDLLNNDIEKAETIERELNLTARILGERYVAQRKFHPIANSEKVARYSKDFVLSSHSPRVIIGVGEEFSGRYTREERRTRALPVMQKLYDMYIESCENEMLGDKVPEEQRLTLERLLEAQLIFERSRHSEPRSKGKADLLKAMAIAQSDHRALSPEAPDRVMIVNLNLKDALEGSNVDFRAEMEAIVRDIGSVRSNGGHVIVQPSFEYLFGAEVCKVSDVYMSLPAFEPFGMGLLEAAKTGCKLIASIDVPAFREVLTDDGEGHDVTFPTSRSGERALRICKGGIGIRKNGGDNADSGRYYKEAAVAINALTLSSVSADGHLTLNTDNLARSAAQLVKQSPYDWNKRAIEFLEICGLTPA